MAGVSVPYLGIWKKWLGSIRLEHLDRANLVLLVEESSDNPWILDDVHQRLADDLGLLFYTLHLRVGIEISEDAVVDLLVGSSVNRVPEIRQVSQMPRLYRSLGRAGVPITQEWLKESLVLRIGAATTKADKTQFRRVTCGLNTLFKRLKEKPGADRLHPHVRALEALVLPEKSRTTRDFSDRCQTFASAGYDTLALLKESYNMRSATEHLNPWDKALQSHPPNQREDVGWHKTRQSEHLACDAYSRLLRDLALRNHFRTAGTIEAFWKLGNDQRRELWAPPSTSRKGLSFRGQTRSGRLDPASLDSCDRAAQSRLSQPLINPFLAPQRLHRGRLVGYPYHATTRGLQSPIWGHARPGASARSGLIPCHRWRTQTCHFTLMVPARRHSDPEYLLALAHTLFIRLVRYQRRLRPLSRVLGFVFSGHCETEIFGEQQRVLNPPLGIKASARRSHQSISFSQLQLYLSFLHAPR